MSLSYLPVDVLTIIAEELWYKSPPSVLALAATSRLLNEVTAPFNYRCLSIKISTGAKLKKDIGQLRASDIGSRYLRHVRHIELTGYMLRQDNEQTVEDEENENGGGNDDDEPRQKLKFMCPGTSFDLEEPLNPPFNEVFCADRRLNDRDVDTVNWHPFVSLLDDLQHLRDIVWQCYGRFAPGLLEALHRRHNSVKVHLRGFRFLSLHDATTDPDELALINSPNLHSLSVLSVWRDSNGKDDHNEAAAMRVLTAAPRLRHFRLLGARPASSPMLHRARQTPKRPWTGFSPEPHRSQHATLHTFSTCCYRDDISKNQLAIWEKNIDFSAIRKASFSVTDADVLSQLDARHAFVGLEELKIGLRRGKTDGLFASAAETFFTRLPQLASLNVAGTLHRELVHTICERHGSTLQSLTITPYEDHYDMAGPPLMLEAEDVELMAQTCPRLTHLKLTIKRTKGNNRETRCYEALGRLRRLEVLKLCLDCSNEPSYPRRLAGGGPLEIESAIINCAIDKTLVRSMWDIVSGSHDDSCLQSLDTVAVGAGTFGNVQTGDMMTIVSHIARSYLVTRKTNGSVADVDIIEKSKQRREQDDQRQLGYEQSALERTGRLGLNGEAFLTVAKIWPLEQDRSNWREAWSSFPLERTLPS